VTGGVVPAVVTKTKKIKKIQKMEKIQDGGGMRL
jgi:hypothetical protein